MSQKNADPKVPMPEAGQDAYLHMNFAALQDLEDQFGEDFFEILQRGFVKPSPVIIARALGCCLKNGEDDKAPWGLTLDQIGIRLYDAQIRVLNGRTLADALEIMNGKDVL